MNLAVPAEVESHLVEEAQSLAHLEARSLVRERFAEEAVHLGCKSERMYVDAELCALSQRD